MLSFEERLDNFIGKILTEKVLLTLALLVLMIDNYLLLFYGISITCLDNWQKIIKPTTIIYFVCLLAIAFLAIFPLVRAIFLFLCSRLRGWDDAGYRDAKKEYLVADELREIGIHEQNEMAYYAYEKHQDQSSENELKRTLYCDLLLVGLFNVGLSFFINTQSLTRKLLASFPVTGGISLFLLLLITLKYGVWDNVYNDYDKITRIKRPRKTT